MDEGAVKQARTRRRRRVTRNREKEGVGRNDRYTGFVTVSGLKDHLHSGNWRKQALALAAGEGTPRSRWQLAHFGDPDAPATASAGYRRNTIVSLRALFLPSGSNTSWRPRKNQTSHAAARALADVYSDRRPPTASAERSAGQTSDAAAAAVLSPTATVGNLEQRRTNKRVFRMKFCSVRTKIKTEICDELLCLCTAVIADTVQFRPPKLAQRTCARRLEKVIN
jgi:hypothetical protein